MNPLLRGIENQFLSPGLAGTTQSGRDGRAAGPHDRLRRVHHHRRGEPIDRESGFHVYGTSRAEGRRTVILLRCPLLPLPPASFRSATALSGSIIHISSYGLAEQSYLAFLGRIGLSRHLIGLRGKNWKWLWRGPRKFSSSALQSYALRLVISISASASDAPFLFSTA